MVSFRSLEMRNEFPKEPDVINKLSPSFKVGEGSEGRKYPGGCQMG